MDQNRTVHKLRILQINAQRSLAVLNELTELVVRKSLDVLLIQEPYTFRGRVLGLGVSLIILDKANEMGEIWVCVALSYKLSIDCVKIVNISDSHSVTGFWWVGLLRVYRAPIVSFL